MRLSMSSETNGPRLFLPTEGAGDVGVTFWTLNNGVVRRRLMSVGTVGSWASVGTVGSRASVGTVGSWASVGTVGSCASVGTVGATFGRIWTKRCNTF
jgi:hypothetical protein